MKCPICNQDMEEIGNLRKTKIYFCHICNLDSLKKGNKTRIIWIDDGKELAEFRLIETGVKFK